MMNEMDDDIKEFHKAERKEMELFLNAFNIIKEKGIIDIEYQKDKRPKPSSIELWFAGLKKWGRSFTLREYELRQKMEY